ncbi:hypothetical protein [Gloeothece verrucosa]|uniref:Uncharacterized protein n=1 Tax=Gloeothece verrucosa (strain PCC 7822) TaxID=497965 RepID=E0U6Q5_GLOV7|nr:hypothetical protein [Gloeothece verrucosa]ADN14814.1 conserved hypothetical protein [Gloeothece verrucosa PCC 7822]
MENTTEDFIGTRKGTFPASVAEIIDDYKLVINKGEKDGIRKGQRMLVYRVSEEDIKDPETGESLGYLELVRGTGKIIYIQEKMSILESDKTPINSYWSAFPSQLDKYIEKLLEGKLLPFENPQIGDKVKPI